MDAPALNAFLVKVFPQIAEHCRVESVGPDVMIARWLVDDRHLRPGGTVSGPTIFALADCAIYCAILSRIGPVEMAVTTSASLDFLRKPEAGRDLLAECRLIKVGRSLAVAEALVRSEGTPEPVARTSMTYAIPRNRA